MTDAEIRFNNNNNTGLEKNSRISFDVRSDEYGEPLLHSARHLNVSRSNANLAQHILYINTYLLYINP